MKDSQERLVSRSCAKVLREGFAFYRTEWIVVGVLFA